MSYLGDVAFSVYHDGYWVSREKRIMHCGRCGIAGHNAKNCKNFGVPKFLKPRKRMSSNTGEDGYESTNTNG
ncbi:hypothetical protein IGI04_004602 [Brassica rapa subsp. trilocularis]|uniref:CCHC-type domain-containing protein n=1 Tax=Brassica rapa subsp. trilocularis TaxID=1813537 RepID=A0ABQ7NC65_BRACM|nr:hypothetical protein IGI04_004602 [Brassica rapa subsp. trilocularis]